jgi:hypothetical protein
MNLSQKLVEIAQAAEADMPFKLGNLVGLGIKIMNKMKNESRKK